MIVIDDNDGKEGDDEEIKKGSIYICIYIKKKRKKKREERKRRSIFLKGRKRLTREHEIGQPTFFVFDGFGELTCSCVTNFFVCHYSFS